MIMFPDEPVDAKTPHPLMRELDERGRRPGESVVAMLRRVLDERDTRKPREARRVTAGDSDATLSRVTITYATHEDFEAAVEAARRMADGSGVVVLPHRATIAHDAPTRHTRITIPPARASWAARLWHDSPVNAAVVFGGLVVGLGIAMLGAHLMFWPLGLIGVCLFVASIAHASACTRKHPKPNGEPKGRKYGDGSYWLKDVDRDTHAEGTIVLNPNRASGTVNVQVRVAEGIGRYVRLSPEMCRELADELRDAADSLRRPQP